MTDRSQNGKEQGLLGFSLSSLELEEYLLLCYTDVVVTHAVAFLPISLAANLVRR